jgi:cell pole-organizing protein PopZ
MNKPAAKEPSMDEILSSIRQIIADDDAAGAPRRPAIQAAPPPMQAAPARPMQPERDFSDMLDDSEPLTLSPAQMLDRNPPRDIAGPSFESLLSDAEAQEVPAARGSQLVDPEDIAFSVEEAEEDELPAFEPPAMRLVETPAPTPVPQSVPTPDVPRQHATVGESAPLPDPTLSQNMADQLLEPATKAAVRNSITRLHGLGIGNPGATIESMMRDMLRPMLKEWLDENLPSVVERMVEKEISRVSRGE